METTVTIYRMDFDAKAFDRLRKIALREGVPDDRSSVIRWAAMQFLNAREAMNAQPESATAV